MKREGARSAPGSGIKGWLIAEADVFEARCGGRWCTGGEVGTSCSMVLGSTSDEGVERRALQAVTFVRDCITEKGQVRRRRPRLVLVHGRAVHDVVWMAGGHEHSEPCGVRCLLNGRGETVCPVVGMAVNPVEAVLGPREDESGDEHRRQGRAYAAVCPPW